MDQNKLSNWAVELERTHHAPKRYLRLPEPGHKDCYFFSYRDSACQIAAEPKRNTAPTVCWQVETSCPPPVQASATGLIEVNKPYLGVEVAAQQDMRAVRSNFSSYGNGVPHSTLVFVAAAQSFYICRSLAPSLATGRGASAACRTAPGRSPSYITEHGNIGRTTNNADSPITDGPLRQCVTLGRPNERPVFLLPADIRLTREVP